MPAAAVMPAAARANRWVFYTRDGTPRTLDQVRERFAARMGASESGGSAPRPAPIAPPDESTTLRMAAIQSPPASTAQAGPSPRYARLAYLMLAELGG
jgi:hypothetical protein